MGKNKIKVCCRCEEKKSIKGFHKQAKSPDGHAYMCKDCIKEYKKGWKKRNPKKVKRNYKRYRENNLDKEKQRWKEYYENNKDSIFERRKERLENDDAFRIRVRLSNRIYKAVKRGDKTKKTEELLGISYDDFKEYLESQFEDGMTWDNYGEWHIDHIIPCAWYDLSKPHHQEECFFYTNLQPLWAKDNLKKSARVE